MLAAFFINGLDTFNIFYLWQVLMKKRGDVSKLLFGTFISTMLVTILEALGIHFIFEYMLFILVFKIIYKIETEEAILGFVLTTLIEMALQLMAYLIIHEFTDDDMVIALVTEIFSIACVIIYSRTKLSNMVTFSNIGRSALIYFTATCSIDMITLKTIWTYYKNIVLDNAITIVTAVNVVVTSQILIYLYILKQVRENEKLKVSNEYNAVIDEIVQEIRQRQHDFVNYKNTIKGIIEVVDDKDIKAAINSYMKDEDEYDNKINDLVYIDNVVIKSIIYRKMCKAKKYNVNFQYDIENNVLDDILSYHDLSNVLNNLLNNAFDEVLKENCTQKNIAVKIFNKNKIPHLIVSNQVVNPNDININEIFTRGYSTKGTGTRGYGLYNVQQIINSYNGVIKINVEYGKIIFDIYFSNSSG